MAHTAKYPKSVLGKSIQKRTFACQGSLPIFFAKRQNFLKTEASSREEKDGAIWGWFRCPQFAPSFSSLELASFFKGKILKNL
jgi:hypothetical protein